MNKLNKNRIEQTKYDTLIIACTLNSFLVQLYIKFISSCYLQG